MQSMIKEARLLVTSELVEFEKYRVEGENIRKFIDHLRGIYRTHLNNHKDKMEDVNMWLVGLGNIRIFINYAPKFL